MTSPDFHDRDDRHPTIVRGHDAAGEAPPDRVAPSPLMSLVLAGLERLEPAERARLDELITPEAAALLTKAYGAEMGALLWPYIADDVAD